MSGIRVPGMKLGMGLSNISSVHLFNYGFHRDKNYFLRINGSQVMIYRGSVKKPKRQQMNENSLNNLVAGGGRKGISANVRKKMINYIHNWFTSIEYAKARGIEHDQRIKKHLGIVTLTLPAPQMHDDREIKRSGLMMWIKDIKKVAPSMNYLWKAESQKNGNIHFHIIIDQFIDMSVLQEKWIRRLSLLGYIQKYYENTGKTDPPCTNVESLKDKTSSGAYVAKYIRKDEGEREIIGRCWGCSDELRSLSKPEIQCQNEELESLVGCLNVLGADAYITDYCVILNNCACVDVLTEKAMMNRYWDSTIKHNVDILYSFNYQAFGEQSWSLWEQDVIDEFNHLGARYLFDNDLIGW